MKYDDRHTVIFDFDGTIADTFEMLLVIYNTIAPRFHCRRVKHEDRAVLRELRPQDFMRSYGVSFWKIPLLVLAVRGMIRRSIVKIKPIPGIAEAVRVLNEKGFRLSIVTTNSRENIRYFLNRWNMSVAFDGLHCSSSIFGKHRVLLKVIRREKLDPHKVLYVGDETRDIEAAHSAGIGAVGAGWGFNAPGALRRAQADFLATSPQDFVEQILVWRGH